MKIRWTLAALRDLEASHSYLIDDQPAAADKTVEKILAGIQNLTQHPEMGRPGRVRGTRELVVLPFVVAYRNVHEVVEIVAIIHGARRWPGSL